MKLMKFLSIFLFLGFVFNSCSSSEPDDEPIIGEEQKLPPLL